MDTGLLRPESARRQRIYATLAPYDQRDGCPSSTVAALDNTLYVFLMLDVLCLCFVFFFLFFFCLLLHFAFLCCVLLHFYFVLAQSGCHPEMIESLVLFC